MTDDAHPADRPHSVGSGRRRAFWADAVADEIEARDPEDPIVVKGGVSPSGVPHIGHVNEIMRGYFVAEALRERGHEVRQVFTSDDRDRLRKVPRRLATLDGEVVDIGAVDGGRIGRNLGKPYTDVPDPFDCCGSYGEHFTRLLENAAAQLEVPVEFVSNTALYERGEFEAVTREVLERVETARAVLAAYQDTVDESYVPFQARCAACGHLTDGIRGVDLEAGTVEYECVDAEAGGRVIEGCGHRGTATLREGKLPWRFEWPAQWAVLGVDFEPFGKDHAEGSWPSGVDIAREVFGFDPPVPMVYEWFTLDGEPLSSSAGNVITVGEVLDLLELEVFRFFFTKTPKRARDFDVDRLDQLVDGFDRFERAYFGEADGGAGERDLARRAYPFAVNVRDTRENIAAARAAGEADDLDTESGPAPGEYGGYRDLLDRYVADRVRIPYTFAAVLGMTDDPALRETMARREGHIPADAPGWAVDDALDRVEKARAWAERTDNEYNYRLAEDLPDVTFEPAVGEALDDLADVVESGAGGGTGTGTGDEGESEGEAIQGAIYETARRHGLDVGEFFAAGYRLFLDEEQGPRLGPFLAALDREFVVGRLRREA